MHKYVENNPKGDNILYSIESLIAINGSYHMNHRVLQSDVDLANSYVEIIENSRTDDGIQVGDIVEYTDKHGGYYRNAHFESYGSMTENMWHICEHPQIPFIGLTGDKKNIRCSTSGGAWTDIPGNLKLIGKRKKYFMDWGHCGSCADGAVTFEALVNVWEYRQPDPLYGEYSTKDYNRHYISYCVDELGKPKNGSQYRYLGNGIAFVNKEEYEVWKRTFRGVEFAGNWANQTVVFIYKRIEKLITKAEFNNLNLLIDTRMCNGIVQVKVEYNDNNKTVTEYSHTNNGSELRYTKPYILARV
jgi:hypothetical protein